MNRISIFLAAALLAAPATLRAQDAATEERLNKLSAHIEDLVAAKEAQDKRLAELARAVDALQRQADKPAGNFASPEDVKQLAEKIKEVDRNRQQDNERVLEELHKLGKTFSARPPRVSHDTPPPAPAANDAPSTPDKGFEYKVQPGDSLSIIAQAYREKNIKVSVDQILKANPGLKAEKLRAGQKIFIPAPPQ